MSILRARRAGRGIFGCLLGVALCGAGTSAAVAQPATPVAWWVHLRSTGYAFQDDTRSGATLDRFGGYQHVRGAVSGLMQNRLSVHVAGRVADDLMLSERVTTRTRLYTGYVKLRPTSRLEARVGRQFLSSTATSLSLDGASVDVRPALGVQASLWGGVRAPYDRDLDVTPADEAGAFGASVRVRPVQWARVGAAFAYRERDGRVSERPLGLDVNAFPMPRVQLRGRAVYDAELEAWSRAEALGRWQPRANAPVVTLQVIDRRPGVDAASYFSRFLNVEERIRLGRASVRYEHRTGFGAEGTYTGTFVDDRTSTHVSLAALFPIGRAGYTTRFGDSGEDTGFFGGLGVDVLSWLRVEGGASVITYALVSDAAADEERDLVTAFAGARATVTPGVDLSVELQRTENPLYDEDVRVLAGLDISAARGTSRFGLTGGLFP